MPTTPEIEPVVDLDQVPDPGTGLTHADRRRAAITVCSYAQDTDEARDMLEALGLLEDLRGHARLAG